MLGLGGVGPRRVEANRVEANRFEPNRVEQKRFGVTPSRVDQIDKK